MFCPDCGANLPDGAKFCQKCGNALHIAPVAPTAFDEEITAVADTSEQPVVPVAPVQPVAPIAPTAPVQPVAPAAPQPPKKGKGLVIGIVIVSIIAVAAIVVAVLFGTGVIGENKKDNDDERPTKSSSQHVDEDDIEVTYEEGLSVPSDADKLPPVSSDITDEKAAIQKAVNDYYTAMSSLNGTAFKNSMSAYIVEVFNQTFDATTLDSLRQDPEVAAECSARGIDIYSPDFAYTCAAISALEEEGGIDNITKISVSDITLDYEATQEELSALPSYLSQELGIIIQNTPNVTAGYEISATLTVYYSDGTQAESLSVLTVLKENGQWKVVPA